jgi:3'-phosphoadenosine 5'-phosphosulfate sulfotransferase (PAPS reductase)/FAD synthetase
MQNEIFSKALSTNNHAIFDGYAKAQNVILRSNTALCSISGGSDSDIVLDIIHNVDEFGKVTYYWIDTGLEYTATKEHLNFLEKKYDIEIQRIKPKKSIPTCVKQYGVPFLSKYVSEQMMRLQAHHFQWENEPLEILLKKYPKCKTALQWWCNCYYADGEVQKMSRFSINRNRFLKEFILQNPPDFPISNKCCEYAKKKPAKQFIKEMDADLEITGLRKSEGGIRSANFKTCFSESKSKGCNTYRPLFWYMDGDKKIYEEHFDIQHSRCYTEYGLKRTGCVGCPFNPHITEELEIIKEHEPTLYKAAVNIFGKSYEYTKKYREFVKMMKAKEKEEKKRDKLLSSDGVSSCVPDDSSCSDSADWSTVSA